MLMLIWPNLVLRSADCCVCVPQRLQASTRHSASVSPAKPTFTPAITRP